MNSELGAMMLGAVICWSLLMIPVSILLETLEPYWQTIGIVLSLILLVLFCATAGLIGSQGVLNGG